MLGKMLPTGTFVSIPLSILQSTYYHAHSGSYLTSFDMLVPLNICLAHAIYDWDRKKGLDDLRIKSVYEKTTSAALIAASCTLNASKDLQPFVPLLYILYHFYDEIKREISIVKPFFVAVSWTCAVYAIPVIIQHDYFANDIWTPLSCFCLMSAWSNFADIKDIDEDSHANISTAATFLGREKSLLLSGVLLFTSIVLHQSSPNYDVSLKVFDLVNIIAFGSSMISLIEEDRVK